MGAATPMSVQRKILDLYNVGKSIGAIAAELKLHRTTVARYVTAANWSAEVILAPAARLDQGDVAALKRMADDFQQGELAALRHEVQALRQLVGDLQVGEVARLRAEVEALRQVAVGIRLGQVAHLRDGVEGLRAAVRSLTEASFLPADAARLKDISGRLRVGYCPKCYGARVWIGATEGAPCGALLLGNKFCDGYVTNALAGSAILAGSRM